MSAMQEESDVETEDDGLEARDNDEAPYIDGSDQHEDPTEDTSLSVPYSSRVDDERHQSESASKSNGTAFSGYRRIQQDNDQLGDENSELVIRPGVERPSSADGSLSPPDDTPSVQVRDNREIELA